MFNNTEEVLYHMVSLILIIKHNSIFKVSRKYE
jgi:hypothetical protein